MKKKPLLIVVLAALVVGVVGFAFFSGGINPERELMAAERNMNNLDSYSIDFEMIMESDDIEGINMILSGVADINQLEKEGRGELGLNLVDMGVSLGASLMYVDGNLYGRATTFPQALPISPEQSEMLTGNDILLIENLPEVVKEALAESEEMEDFSLTDLIAEMEEFSEKVWKEAVTVSDSERDNLNGVRARRYSIDFDAEKMVEMTMDLMEKYGLFDSLAELGEEDISEMREEMEREMIKAYQNMEVSVWSDGDYILKVTVSSVTEMEQSDLQQFEMTEEETEQFSGEIKTVFEVNYSNFNESFEITAPEEYLTLEEVMQQFFLPFSIMELY